MICPYLWNETEIQINEAGKMETYEYENASGEKETFTVVVNDISTMKNKYPMECMREECACFVDNHCNRR